LDLVGAVEHFGGFVEFEVDFACEVEGDFEQAADGLCLLPDGLELLVFVGSFEEDVYFLLEFLAADLEEVALLQTPEYLPHLFELLLLNLLPHRLHADGRHLVVALLQDLIPQSVQQLVVAVPRDAVLLEQFLAFGDYLVGPFQQQVLDDVVDVEVEFGDGVFKCFLDVLYVLLEQFRQDGEVLVPEPDLVDVHVLLPQHSHQLVHVTQDVLVLVLAD
jgi:hypothetical protein